MICAMMQPTYLPWIGFFDLMDQVDKFVLLDDYKLEKSSWQTRNKIKGNDGKELWLRVPVSCPFGRMETKINQAEIVFNEEKPYVIEQHLNMMKDNYKKTKHFKEVMDYLEQIYFSTNIKLSETNYNLLAFIARKIGIKTRIYKTSEMNFERAAKDQGLVNICEELGCNEYLTSPGAYDYLGEKGGVFAENGIKLYYHNYNHPIYEQINGEFMPFLSIVDLLFNVGLENALETIKKGRTESIYFKDYKGA